MLSTNQVTPTVNNQHNPIVEVSANMHIVRCNAKERKQELFEFAAKNGEMSFMFEWLFTHDELQYGTQAEMVLLYVDNELVSYGLLEDWQFRTDKTNVDNGQVYRNLGLIHFVTKHEDRRKGYGTILAKRLYTDIIEERLEAHKGDDNINFYMTAGGAAALMKKSGIRPYALIPQMYSDVSFPIKVVKYLKSLDK
jgi:hypothetical protein